MLKVTYRKYGIRLSHVYFASEKDIRKNIFEKESGDLIFLHGCADNSVRGGYCIQPSIL